MNRLKEWLRPLVRLQRRMAEVQKMKTYPLSQERISYSCPLTPAKKCNLVTHAINRSLLPFAEFSLPHILHVGVTTRCNLRCAACPTGNNSLGRAGEDLDFETFRRAVDSLRDSLMLMLLWDWGEPFLHPRLADMIEYAGQSGVHTVVSTNGNVVYSPDRLERLIRACPTTIVVCVDGADQKTYEMYRRGGKLETVLQTIRQLVETRDRLGQTFPMVDFRTLATKGSEKQMPDLLTLAQQSGADLFSVKTLRPFDYRGEQVDETLVPESNDLSRYSYKLNERTAGAREGLVSEGELTCGKPCYAPTLNSNGDLAFCSYARRDNEFFGSISEKGFSNVWKNKESRCRRIEFLKEVDMPTCRTCYFRSNPAPTIIHQVLLRPLPDGIDAEAIQSPEDFLNVY